MERDAKWVLRGWWIQIARMGMTTSEVVDSIIEELDRAGYKIVRKSKRD